MMQLFIPFTWIDALDIFLVAVLLYQLYHIVRGTVAVNIFIGIALFYILWIIVKALNMQLFSHLLGRFIDVGVIALIIVFQQELRKLLLLIGTTNRFNWNNLAQKVFNVKWKTESQLTDAAPVIKACKSMSETRTGALIVITMNNDLSFYANTGDNVDSEISARLIESIFFKNNPLHDGAVIVAGNRIRAARCVLPVTEQPDFPSELGLRHRAAAGITENSDALAIVVSEQTGSISFVKDGKISNDLSEEQLTEILEKELG